GSGLPRAAGGTPRSQTPPPPRASPATHARRDASGLRLRSALEGFTTRVLVVDEADQVAGGLRREQLLELRAEVRDEAHALDDHVDDLPLAVRLAQAVVDEDVVGAAAAVDARPDGAVAARLLAIADDRQRLVLVAVDALAVRDGQVLLELVPEAP